MASASAVVAAVGGLKKAGEARIDPWPFACLVVGLAIGAPGGVAMRSYGLLGPNVLATADSVHQRSRTAVGLNSTSGTDDCKTLASVQRKDLQFEFQKAHNEALSIIGHHVPDSLALDSIRIALCRSRP
ncbi:MAG: hypothetical protein JWM41_2027 [Gemmatimonadetes bacterium]|nr:hypothetical protein [Gemmatimonadota bacterium]